MNRQQVTFGTRELAYEKLALEHSIISDRMAGVPKAGGPRQFILAKPSPEGPSGELAYGLGRRQCK